jgi:diacylglycerol kinase
MDYYHPDIAIQARSASPPSILSGLRRIFHSDPGLTVQLVLTLLVVTGGIALQLSAIQWILVVVVTGAFLLAGICRRAALLQVDRSTQYSPFQVSRIKAMGNALVAITGGLSLLTYLLVFVPKITPLL